MNLLGLYDVWQQSEVAGAFDGLGKRHDGFEKRFDHLDSQIDSLAIATANGFAEVHENLNDFKQETSDNFEKVNTKLYRIENVLVANHDRRLDKLEDFALQARRVLKLS